jgi:flagellar hook-basal body complex protein FliE
MNVSLKPFDFQAAVARAGLRPDGMPRTDAASGVEGGGSFATAMHQALKSVSAQQVESSRLQREVALGNPNVSLEQAVISGQKAQIGFQAAIQVRNRLLSAYTDIMNMQV